MRYRAIKDFIATDREGKNSLVAWGDKVFVIEHTGGKEPYSFRSRQSLGLIGDDVFDTLFADEETFRKNAKERTGGPRPFTKPMGIVLLFILLSLGGMAQTSPIAWSWKAVRVDSNYFEFHLTADMFRGWWIYKPNSQDVCPYSPLITFERSEGMKPVENVDVIKYLRSEVELPDNVHVVPPLCPLAQFSGSVTFIQVFRMPINKSGIVRGKVVYCAMSRYMYEEARTIEFELRIGQEGTKPIKLACGDGTALIDYASDMTVTKTKQVICIYQSCKGVGRIQTIYPRGKVRKVWWFMKHPFGKPYISRRIVESTTIQH